MDPKYRKEYKKALPLPHIWTFAGSAILLLLMLVVLIWEFTVVIK